MKVFGVAVTDPNSAMIYTPAGLYPRFVPPRIVTGNGNLCDGRLTENNSVEKGQWSDGHKSYDGILPFVLGHIKPELMAVNPKNSNFPDFSNWYLANVAPVYNKAIAGFQNNYDQIIHENLRSNLLRDKFTDGCSSSQHCMQSWKTPKVSQGVYQSMEVEMRVLLGLLNEIYIYPTEMMAKARELDDKNPISTSSILREKRKAQLTPEAR